jgi:putative DNA primase/helicase
VITGTDRGIWRRIRLVPWCVAIARGEQRPQDDVVSELVADGAWMLRWMVAGFADWQADHHWVAEEVQAATEAYRVEQDQLGGFLGEGYEFGPFKRVPVGDLYEAYKGHCTAAGEELLGKIAFGKLLTSRGFAQKKDGNGDRWWQGIGSAAASYGKSSGKSHESQPCVDNAEKLPGLAVTPDGEVF